MSAEPGTDTADAASGLGPRVAAHRARRGVKVSALARQVGVSPSLISQIERGQSRPSVSTLFALAEALDVPVDAFFRDAPRGAPAGADATAAGGAQPGDADGGEAARAGAPRDDAPHAHRYLVRRDERAAIDIEGGVRWERLTPTQLPDLEFLELVYAPGAESHSALYLHPGMEMVLLLSGRLDIFVGFDQYALAPGDSICFPSTTPHRYVNPGDETARAVTVILPEASEV